MSKCPIINCSNNIRNGDSFSMCSMHYYRKYNNLNMEAPKKDKSLYKSINNKHGHCRRGAMTPEYRAWSLAKARCNNPNTRNWEYWGGRGIKMCPRWSGDDGFQNFIDDMGIKPSPEHSLDRVDNNGDYSPNNCRWATASEQNSNTRKNRIITFNNTTKTMSEWARAYSIGIATLHSRLTRQNMSFEEAVTTPVRKRHKR